MTVVLEPVVGPKTPDGAPSGEDVDFVYTCVGGSEPRFKSLLDGHVASWPEGLGDGQAAGEERFRDNDELRFSLRSVERFAPWARRIFIVTNGQKPDWLNLNHPGITLVTHESIFPDQAHLPTFNSCAIECNLHRIPGLAERFVYINDDCFLGRAVTKEDFFDPAVGHRFRFDRWGISPRAGERTANDCAIARVQEMLYEKFRLRRHWNNPAHVPHFIVKSLFREVVLTWPEAFEHTSSQRFRSRHGIQPVYLYINYVIDKGLPHSAAVMGAGHKAEYAFAHLTRAHLLEIMASRPKFFAINDCDRDPGFRLADYLAHYFPEPSSFERVTTGGGVKDGISVVYSGPTGVPTLK